MAARKRTVVVAKLEDHRPVVFTEMVRVLPVHERTPWKPS